MESSHNLRFRWNDHIPHLSKVFAEQRLDEQYCDTTIVSEDGFIIKAHCMILTMTSGYFARVLYDVTPDQHPIVILHGVNYKQLACVMDYIYQGMTQVDQCLMESVLDLADMLEIKGLCKMKSNSSIKKLLAPAVPHSVSTLSAHKCHPLTAPSNCSGLKIDSEEIDRIDDSSSDRLIMDSKMEEQKTQLSSSSAIDSDNLSQLSDSIDQTLGIDLSLSKGTGDENGVHEAPSLQKRNITESGIDPEFGKLCERVKHPTSVPYKKKCFRKTSGSANDVQISTIQETRISGRSTEFSLEKLAEILSKSKAELIDCKDSFNKSKSLVIKKPDLGETVVELDSEVEVSCSDGGLTISVTTGTNPDNFLSPFKKDLSCAHVSLSLRRKKQMRTKKEIEEAKRKWLAKERKSLFSGYIMNRPTTRSSIKHRSQRLTESVSINCDPPFPTEETTHQSTNSWNAESNVKEFNIPKEIAANVKKKRSLIKSRKLSLKRKISSISPLTLFTLPPSKEKGKQTRISLTLEEKIKVIEAFLDGKSQRQIARMFGIGKTQVSGIVKRREDILSFYRANVVNGEKLTMKRHRKSEYAILNEHLIKWYRHMTVVAGIKITTGMLRAKALQIAPELGCHDFKGSNGWLATFKTNNNLKFSKSRPKKLEPRVNLNCREEPGNNEEEETEYFEDDIEDEQGNDLSVSHGNASDNTGGGTISLPLSTRVDHLDVGGPSTAPQSSGVGSAALGNSILTSSPLPKPPQMSNVSLGSNLAYNLTRDHSRGEIGHIGDLHPSSAVNPSTSLTHPSLSKPDAPLSYKSEDSLSYGYDPQSRMNDGASRGTTEYNYTHYGFPGTYYGYHFLGQY